MRLTTFNLASQMKEISLPFKQRTHKKVAGQTFLTRKTLQISLSMQALRLNWLWMESSGAEKHTAF